MIIDFHVHIFPPQVKTDRRLLLERDATFCELYQNPQARIATADDLIQSMDHAGIDVSVVQGFAWSDPSILRETNDYIQESAARFPGRLVPYCAVRPEIGAASPEEVTSRLRGNYPIRGVGELRLDDPRCRADRWAALGPLCETALQANLPVLIHASEPVGHEYPGKGRMTPALLWDLIGAFPDWTMVLAHLGGGLPFYSAMPEVRKALQNVYIDTAAWSLLYGPEVFPPLIDLFGYQKILFATDYPVVDQSKALAKMRSLPLASEALTDILGGNASSLLGRRDG